MSSLAPARRLSLGVVFLPVFVKGNAQSQVCLSEIEGRVTSMNGENKKFLLLINPRRTITDDGRASAIFRVDSSAQPKECTEPKK